jgi:putative ABC transport system permease protein
MPSISFKTAFRSLWKNKTYSTLNILGLAIGIACAGLIFLWVEDEMTFDAVHVKKDRLYSVQVNLPLASNLFTMGSTPRPLAAALKREIPGIVNTARASDQGKHSLFSFGDKALYASGKYADPAIFNMFTLTFVQGSAQSAFAQLYSLVITESTARKFFGTGEKVVGRTVRMNNELDYVVTGVLKDLPDNSTLQFEWLAPYEVTILQSQAKGGGNDGLDWGSYGPYTYVELDAKADVTAINKQLKDFIHGKRSDQNKTAFLFPMSDWRLYGEFENGQATGGGRIRQVRMLSVIAWIILLIACINFMNLATASSQQRAKEVGVRKVLGAGRGGLIAQFIGEALLMSLLAAVVALTIILLALPAYNQLMQKELSMGMGDPTHIAALLVIVLVCGLVAGSYPSVYLSSFNPVRVLKGVKIKMGSAAWIRKGLVVFQFTVSVVFIISTMIVYLQLQHVKDRNLGFNKDHLIEVDMQHDVFALFPSIKEELLHTGLIENVATSDHVTLRGGNTYSAFRWEGKSPDEEISVAFRNVSPEFVATSGMKIIAGRDFTVNAAADGTQIIISESLAKLMGKESAVGKIIQSPRGNKEGVLTNLTVVGVIKDYVYGNMYGTSGPVMFLCQPKDAELVYVRAKPQSNPEQVIAKIGMVMKQYNPAYPLEYKFVDDQFNALFKNEMLISQVSGVFAVLAIIISCLGLFGLAAYTAERRIKEIGIRKVLGASVAGLAGLLSKDFLQLVGISCLVAFPVAWWIMQDWLQGYEYRITISWWIFLVAGVAAVLIALLTISTQAIRAAMMNPVRSLRSE